MLLLYAHIPMVQIDFRGCCCCYCSCCCCCYLLGYTVYIYILYYIIIIATVPERDNNVKMSKIAMDGFFTHFPLPRLFISTRSSSLTGMYDPASTHILYCAHKSTDIVGLTIEPNAYEVLRGCNKHC